MTDQTPTDAPDLEPEEVPEVEPVPEDDPDPEDE